MCVVCKKKKTSLLSLSLHSSVVEGILFEGVWFGLFGLGLGFLKWIHKMQPPAVFSPQALQNWTSPREPESEADSCVCWLEMVCISPSEEVKNEIRRGAVLQDVSLWSCC